MNECCKSGAIVCAGFYHKAGKMLIGKIEPNSEIERIKSLGNIKWLKAVQLKDVRKISYTQCPVLFAIKPPGKTVSNWKSAKEIPARLIDHEHLDRNVHSLAPSQQEVLCYEYLLMTGKLIGLLMPIGRTLENVDIHGIDKDGRDILAQVTYADDYKKVKEKADNLRELKGGNTALIFFGQESQREKFQKDYSDVAYVSLERVFETIDKDKKLRKIISKMLGYP